MEDNKTFKTKTGFCHILPDKIVLTRDGMIGNIESISVGNTMGLILLIYSGLSIALFYFAFDSYKNGQIAQTIFFSLLGAFLLYSILISTNNSTTPIIERTKIKEIKLTRGTRFITRSRFEVFFEDEKGKIKKRLIMLPGSLTGGQTETDKAIKIMKAENLIPHV